MRSRVVLAATLIAAAALRPGAAQARGEDGGQGTVAVLPLLYEAPVSEGDSASVRQALGRLLSANDGALPGAEGQPLRALPTAEVDRLLVATDLTCNTARCLKEAARTLRARWLLGGRLERGQAATNAPWTLALWLYDRQSGRTAATVQDRCEACGANDLRGWSAQVLEQLLETARESRGARIAVQSRPSGASVTIDGTPVGVTDMVFGVQPGRHTVVVTLAGRHDATNEVEVAPGGTATVDAQLLPAGGAGEGEGAGAGAADRGGAGGSWVRVLKWTALGGAVAAVGAGAALLALDGRETCDADYRCAKRYETLAPGIALVAAGGALGIASGVLFWLDARRGNRTAAVAVPWVGPGVAGLGATVKF